MSSILPQSVEDLVEALKLLPGVGTRSAERYAYYLLRSQPTKAKQLGRALDSLHAGVDICQTTFALIPKGHKQSDLYTNPDRDKTTIAIVAEPFDILAIENIGSYKGTYHVLGGLLSPIDGVGPEDLRLEQLLERITKDSVTEVILATNASVEGESTALLIQRTLDTASVKLTRLAQGLPIGVDLEYADKITLSRALEGRRNFS